MKKQYQKEERATEKERESKMGRESEMGREMEMARPNFLLIKRYIKKRRNQEEVNPQLLL